MADELTRPNDEEYALLVQELRDANKEVFSLEHVKRMDEAEIPGFEPLTIGTALYGVKAHGSKRKVPWGRKWEEAIAMSKARVDITQAALDDYTAREQAYIESKAPPTTDLSTPSE